MKQELPIDKLKADLSVACGRSRRIVLSAPTGSGKSTRLPQMLLDLKCVDGQILVLQPRRMAARLLARRVAQERGVKCGTEVGYQIRFERVESAETKIKFITEALLLRQLASDPDLSGVGAIIFDEFHERNIYSDVALSLARQLQEKQRPDLLLVVMSATLDTAGVAQWLKPAETLVSEGRTYPVNVEYVPTPRTVTRPIWDSAAEQVGRLLREESEGDVLVFMPGSYEIMRTIQAIKFLKESSGVTVLPLHGELSASDQDNAIQESNQRKVIVSTNVAETSLTIPGVRMVVDSGLARIARYDSIRGIDTLLIESIAQASAEQRAGRAGRTGPGRCIRLWSHTDHQARAPRETPEIKRMDLTETILLLLSMGWADLESFPWYESPNPQALTQAFSILKDIGAINEENLLTPLGKKMAVFPAHPRYARMLMAADELNCVTEVSVIAGLSQGRDILLRKIDQSVEQARENIQTTVGSDFFIRMALLQKAKELKFDPDACQSLGIQGQSARQADQAAQQFLRIAESQGLKINTTIAETEQIQKSLLAGFIDRLAVRLDAGTLRCALVHHRRGELRRESMVRSAKLLVAAEIDEIQTRGEVTTYLNLATEIKEEWLKQFFPKEFYTTHFVKYDATQRKVVTRIERRFRDLVLEASEQEGVSSDEASQLLAKEVLAGRLELEKWDHAVDAWINRVNFLAKHCPELSIPLFDESGKRMVVEQICQGATAYRDIRDRPVMSIVRDWLTHEQLMALDTYCPEKITLPRKKHPAKIDYTHDGEALIEATVQELYDVPGAKLKVCLGKVPLIICIQSPARRTQQRTTDLDAFWKGSYELVKKELKGRYPKHEWR